MALLDHQAIREGSTNPRASCSSCLEAQRRFGCFPDLLRHLKPNKVRALHDDTLDLSLHIDSRMLDLKEQRQGLELKLKECELPQSLAVFQRDIPRRIFQIPPAPAFFDQRVIGASNGSLQTTSCPKQAFVVSMTAAYAVTESNRFRGNRRRIHFHPRRLLWNL